MKLTFLYCLLTFVIASFPAFVRADTVTILSDEWYPINGKPNSSHPGYIIEIIQEILLVNGRQLDYQLAPWKRSILEVRRGNADCIIGAYISDAPDFIFTEQTWGKSEFYFYTRSNYSWQFDNLSDLINTRIGVISGYAYTPELDLYIEKNKEDANVQLTSGTLALEQNIRKLLANRLDAIVAYKPALQQKIKELKLENEIEYAGTLKPSQDLYVACSPNKKSSKSLVELLDSGILELNAQGQLKQILDKYGIEEWLN